MDWVRTGRCSAPPGRTRARALDRPGVVLVATIRTDGSPRLSAVEPLVLAGVLWLSMLWGSRKAADLHRDPRILVHSAITNRDGGAGEFKIRGSARGEFDRQVQCRYADAVAAALAGIPSWAGFTCSPSISAR